MLSQNMKNLLKIHKYFLQLYFLNIKTYSDKKTDSTYIETKYISRSIYKVRW